MRTRRTGFPLELVPLKAGAGMTAPGTAARLRRHGTFLYITQTTTPIATMAPARTSRNVCVSNATRSPFAAVRSMRLFRPFA